MPKLPEGVSYQTDWEDEECAGVKELVCSCGTNLLEGYTDYVANHEERIACPSCGKIYQFIWVGMVLEERTK